MNFTKEYIELCKDKKIQELRPIFQYGDAVLWERFQNMKTKTLTHDLDYLGQLTTDFARNQNSDDYWLPTSDQLDEEIIKICKEADYAYRVDVDSNYCWNTQCEIYSYDENEMVAETQESNALVAKIKLLLALKEN